MDPNKFDHQLEELNDWQKNSTNPGHFIGTGRIPLPIKNISKSPILSLFFGIIFAILPICALINDFSFETLFNNLLVIIISIIYIIRGLFKLTKR
ncbi:MAG: hypothetical protein RR636_14945 [Clostridium sp.]|uniref:hypothetical protein n=1 Tax=Clostridium sp. TaxID=1506 RepID=UPI00321743E6